MGAQLGGMHHITAIVDEPQTNIDFYTEVLGLRLVKQTVNFDDPYTYHLYYGDAAGHPGTIVTFFPWPGASYGSNGTGQISTMAFAVPAGALSFWQTRLDGFGIRYADPEVRFGAPTLALYDPAGLLIELVETAHPARFPDTGRAEIPAGAALQGLFGVTLTVAETAATAAFLHERLGFQPAGAEGERERYTLGSGSDTAVVDLVGRPDVPRGRIAVGSIHHVAWRAADDVALEAWRGELKTAGANVTDIRDRRYFRSIYFREPGGALFEIATDAPGFAIDEPAATLGQRLQLPPWLEPQREAIQGRLPEITVPGQTDTPTEETAMTQPDLGFTHQWLPATQPDAPVLLLLHGTGGDEHDLIGLGRMLYPGAALLSPRGKVLENGMPRFFRRLAEGVFDLDDLRQRTHELADFVAAASAAYGFDPQRVVAVGFSNGANIAASTLLLRPGVLSGAVLFHAMVPLEPAEQPDLSGVPVFMGASRQDPMIPQAQTAQLAQMLEAAGADVELHWQPGGHALNRSEVAAASEWLRRVAQKVS